MNEVMRCFKEGYRQTGEGYTMVYADDTAVWSDDKQELEEALVRWNNVLTVLKMSVEKTEIMKVCRGKEEDIVVEIQGRKVKNIEVKYLGSVFSSKVNNKQKITDRIMQYTKSTGALHPLLRDAHIPLATKKIMFESILTPILMYGADTWTTDRKDRSKNTNCRDESFKIDNGKDKKRLN